MIDSNLEREVILYNQSKKKAFRNGIIYNTNIEYERILKSRYNKVSRVRKHLVYLLYWKKYHYFLTFTFDNDLIKRCDRTKRDLIKNAMESFSSDIYYIMNIDFGKKNEREHFHCIVGTNCSDNLLTHLLKEYPCRLSVQPITINHNDIIRLSKYINKLSNHCCKDTTRNRRIVYNFKGYDIFKPPLNRRLYMEHAYNLGLW